LKQWSIVDESILAQLRRIGSQLRDWDYVLDKKRALASMILCEVSTTTSGSWEPLCGISWRTVILPLLENSQCR